MESKTGKSLYFVFGKTDQVRDFDQHHVSFKNFRYQTSADICSNILSNLKPKVKAIFNDAKRDYKNWEKIFFEKNGEEPGVKDLDGEIRVVFKKMTHARVLIKQWSL